MKQTNLEIIRNFKIADSVWQMELKGDISDVKVPGQFINISLPGYFLRRPISVCDVRDGILVILYKEAGAGTRLMTGLPAGTGLDVLTGLGNGFDISASGTDPVIIGGGIGCAPLLWLAKKLREKGSRTRIVLGFNKKSDIILEKELSGYAYGGSADIVTADGSYGLRGFVTDAVSTAGHTYFYACGPMPMLRALYRASAGCRGQFSLEERMGCGFGACMGCSVAAASGPGRVCSDGPVFEREELKWED